ncbi:hypothetical protein Agub_g10721 [Astrephomene gubernaculifera]|uniref:Uncharacterized protein n=1 Tax=Astrephomene gubernaculifera TaxID=47775 RepID=A0AAD3DVI8_9CHLO|nr:hypothetical protein Agub_g10721 [Astrephomene gubernaculifera]
MLPSVCVFVWLIQPAGLSMGGTIAWLCAAADPRVAVVAPVLGVQSFGWALEHNAFHGRVESTPLVYQAAADELQGCKGGKVDAEAVRAVWCKLMPGKPREWIAPCVKKSGRE